MTVVPYVQDTGRGLEAHTISEQGSFISDTTASFAGGASGTPDRTAARAGVTPATGANPTDLAAGDDRFEEVPGLAKQRSGAVATAQDRKESWYTAQQGSTALSAGVSGGISGAGATGGETGEYEETDAEGRQCVVM